MTGTIGSNYKWRLKLSRDHYFSIGIAIAYLLDRDPAISCGCNARDFEVPVPGPERNARSPCASGDKNEDCQLHETAA